MRRFEYTRMTGDEFSESLETLEMPPEAFARITGMDARRVKQMAAGGRDIPFVAGLVLHLLHNVPRALGEARQWAAENIIRDNENPARGDYPYLGGDE